MLSDDMTRFVDLNRCLGFKFRTQHGLLRSFVAFAEAHGDEFVRRDRVLDWASQAPSPPQRRNRIVMIRRFALALCAEDIRHEVPAADALGHATFRRRTPHIYTPDEIIRLLGAAAALLPAGSIRPLTYTTLFGLLAATGMRISEALAVRLDDITADGLVIRQTKFQKSRLLPLHNTTSRALNQYLRCGCSFGRRLTHCSCPPQAMCSATTPCRPSSCVWRDPLGCEVSLANEVLASTTCATPSRFARLNSVATTPMPSHAISSRSPPISATLTSRTPIGICRPPPS